ncbi:MAG: ABC transporter ATP-binding protein [Chloroflexota bacterium]|jgi:ABC-2 type transport system ATP-binding protein
MSASILTVDARQLTCKFGNFLAVNEVSFYIPQGEIFGLLGPNGAGKTTTIRLLCGLMRPTSGEAIILGMNVARQADAIKQRIGYMSQKFSLYNDLTVQENISFYAAIYGVPRSQRNRRIKEVLDLTGLSGLEGRFTLALSGAWRQRLALACAIVHQPEMLFLDEATAGVDPISRREFWDLIYAMAGMGMSVLATTHYMDEAEYCNTIGMMYGGKMIAVASPDTLKDQMPGTLLQVEVDETERAERLLDNFPGVLDAAIHGAMLHVVVEDENMMETVRDTLAAEGMLVHRIEYSQPSLEDVFISLIERRHRTPSKKVASTQEG